MLNISSIFPLFLLVTGQAKAVTYEMDDVREVAISVFDPELKTLYFSGQEALEADGDQLRKTLRYIDAGQKVLGRETTTIDRKQLQVIQQESESLADGESTTYRVEGGEALIRFREKTDAAVSDERMKIEPNSYHPNVLNLLVLRNWSILQSKGELPFEMIIPFRSQVIAFKIVKKDSVRVQGEVLDSFAIIPRNFLIRAFAPYMEMRFRRGERPVLRQFLGPSPIPVAGEKHKQVAMLFDYPERIGKTIIP